MSSQRNTTGKIDNSSEEQKICIQCGFCCDGTLFLHAGLERGERGSLPEKIENNIFSESDREYFRLPCRYFSGRCTIYYGVRAKVCSSFRCQLLKDFADNKISFTSAVETVRVAQKIRVQLIEQFRESKNSQTGVNFRQILASISDIQNPTADDELFQARCNIFEALLIRHFRSADDFEKLIMK
jgi:hypothetical protein